MGWRLTGAPQKCVFEYFVLIVIYTAMVSMFLALRRNVLSFGERDEEVEREKKEEREGGRRMFKFVWNFVVPTF